MSIESPNEANEDKVPSSASPQEAQEIRETPVLSVEVVEPCASTGSYIGLGGKQRRALGVELADVVLATQDGEDIGLFVVGKGKKALLKQAGKCAGNLPEGVDGQIQLQALTESILNERSFSFPLTTTPEFDERHEGRLQKIATRFPEVSEGGYMVIPTSLAILLGAPYVDTDRKTFRKIFTGKYRIASQVHELAMVPSGEGIAFTNALAEKLGMKDVSQISIGIQGGCLVLDRVE